MNIRSYPEIRGNDGARGHIELTTALYLEKREEVDHYMEVINRLSTQALTPDRTTRFPQRDPREI